MKKSVELSYGRKGLLINVPDSTQVVVPKHVDGVSNESDAIEAALAHPIASPPLAILAKDKQHVVVTHSDITRATPNDRILPILLRTLEEAGVARDDITLILSLIHI